jgi:hypothetical protein
MGKKKPNQYFRKRGVQIVPINFNGEKVDVTLDIPTNLQHNELMEKYTLITPEGTADIRMAEFAEAQMVRFIVDLPFDVPVNNEMTIFKSWKDASEDERKIAVNLMEDTLHDGINKAIVKSSNLSEEDKGN